jgi:hypothetical protein
MSAFLKKLGFKKQDDEAEWQNWDKYITAMGCEINITVGFCKGVTGEGEGWGYSLYMHDDWIKDWGSTRFETDKEAAKAAFDSLGEFAHSILKEMLSAIKNAEEES